jgi:signal transduction histidine kinase
LATTTLLFDVQSPYRLAVILLSGILLCLSGIIYLLRNRAWKGLRPTNLTLWVLALSGAALSTQFPVAYPFGDMTRFAGRFNLLAVIIFSFLFEIAFFGMIVARQVRDQLLQSKRANRLQRQAIVLKEKEQISAQLADERYHLLKMLTHEVRQPLNTAQAALQSVTQEIAEGAGKPNVIQSAVDRASVTLNSIALSISNSILGATLITKGRAVEFDMIDLCSVAQLALLDINPRDRSRITTHFEQDIVYAEADPIVLRLALRNLLENALKYSVVGSEVTFEIILDEDSLATRFRVSNQVNDPSILEGNIIGRDKRGVDSRYDGYGLGLYIVKEVADLHHGELNYAISGNSIVTFEIIIPS